MTADLFGYLVAAFLTGVLVGYLLAWRRPRQGRHRGVQLRRP